MAETLIAFLLTLLAICATSAAAALLYLGSAGQRLLAQPLPSRISLLGGGALLAISLVLFWQVTGPAAAVFCLMTLTMMIWTVLPFPVALLTKRKGRAR